MKTRTSFLTRCLALVMALVLLVSSSNLGIVLQASAATDATVTTAELVAKSYGLTDAEKALLNSGMIAGTETISYSIPEDADNLVTVDTENKTIKATAPEGWTADNAEIVVGAETKETVALTGGVGTYTFDGNAFAVKVNYSLKKEVAGQEAMLNAGFELKADIANMDAVAAQDGSLWGVEQIVSKLWGLMSSDSVSSFFEGSTAKAVVQEMNNEITANGQIALRSMIAAYSAAFKTTYLAENGKAMQAEVIATNDQLTQLGTTGMIELSTALNNIKNFLNNPIYGPMLGVTLEEIQGYEADLSTAKNYINNITAALAPIAADDWYAANNYASVANTNGAALDELVAALGEKTAVTVVNPLTVAAATVQANLSMFNVTVTVALKVVADAVDSAELVNAGSKTAVVTLAKDATAAEILAAVEANGIEAAAKGEWAAYVDGKFEATATALPETLTEDIAYTITYAPKNFAVTTNYGADATVPYGYKMTLPVNEDPTKAYDYKVNGEAETQGAVITIVGDTEITRTSGKAYTNSNLYQIIADNNGNDYADEILTSGALKGNVAIAVRKPDPADAESVLKLEGNVLTANDYDAAYEGLSWKPYTYGAEGTENAFSGNTADWTDRSVKVKYILNLTNLAEKAANTQATVKALKAEAAEQMATLEVLASKSGDMAQLNKSMLGALSGMINATDLHADPAKNAELQAYFTGLVQGIMANNLTGNQLTIYTMLEAYNDPNNGGLNYYYQNNAAVLAEVEVLSGYLTGMLADAEKQAALATLLESAGYGQYADKISGLADTMASVKAALTAPNAAIDVNSPNLYKLTAALEKDGEVVFTGETTPYILSETLTATDDSVVMVQLFVEVNGKSEAYTTAPQNKGYVLTQADVDALVASAEAFAAKELGAKKAYYTVDLSALNALVGTELNDKQTNVTVTYVPKEYTVSIGDALQTITIENTAITLPAHPTNGWVYTYTVFERSISVAQKDATIYLTEAELAQFGEGIYPISRTETQPTVETEGNEYITESEEDGKRVLTATVPASLEGMTGMATELVKLGYSYIELNGKALLESDPSTTISLQTLMDAILSDNAFCSQTLIDAHNNNGGKIFTAEMNLGNGPDDIILPGVKFVFALKNSNADLGKVAKGLETIKPYLTFQAKDGVLNVKANLPEKIYEVYLSALLATGNVDKEDMNAVNDEIAYQFLYDYVDMIVNSDVNTTTYTNTLKNFGKDYDLTGYEDYYQMLVKALKHDGVTINDPAVEGFDMSVTAGSRAAIEKIFNLIGMDMSSYNTQLALVKEYQPGQTFSVNVLASLDNLPTSYEALILDLKASSDSTVKTLAKKFDYTNDLPARVKSVADQAAVILLADVDGDLNFPGTTIIDLNGFKVNGSISAKGDLFVVDSRLDTYTLGEVTGSVSATGAVHITGGKFGTDVSKYLKDGYKQVDGYVQNVLYTIEAKGDTATFVINSDYLSEVEGYLPHVQTLAVDIAVDVALNYFTAAAMSVDGNQLYAVDFVELIHLLTKESKVDGVLDRGVDSLNHVGITAFANAIIEDLLDFGGIAEALKNDTAVAAYNVATNPWKVEIEHITDGNYLDIGLVSNPDITKALNIEIVVKGSNSDRLITRLEEFDRIITVKNITVALDDPDYIRDQNTVNVSGNAKAEVVIDLTKNPEYLNVMAVYMASVSDEDTKAQLVHAVDAGYRDIIKSTFDSATAQKIFKGLKDLSRNKSFEALASELGFTSLSAEAKRIGNLYHILMCGAGKALEVLNITGPNAEMAGLVENGTYTLERTFTHNKLDGKPSYRGYAVEYDFNNIDVKLTVKVFSSAVIRLSGEDRVLTSIEVAEKMKDTINVRKFDDIILANGNDFPDALSGSYLASELEAPIVLYRANHVKTITDYVKANLADNGKVIVVGGVNSVPETMVETLKADAGVAGMEVVRLAGDNRYLTNLEILKYLPAAGKHLVVCDGLNYPDVLSASATGMPIMILNTKSGSLTQTQKDYLSAQNFAKITIVGGPNSVSNDFMAELRGYADVTRVYGATRVLTSVEVAKAFFPETDTAVIADGWNYPDGLVAGPLAHIMGAPLMLISNSDYQGAKDYVEEKDVTIGYVAGGPKSISDKTALDVYNAEEVITPNASSKYPLK